MKVYTQYVKDYDLGLATLLHLQKKNSKFVHFLQEAKENPLCEGKDLQTFLIMPVQRIPRYELLLRVNLFILCILCLFVSCFCFSFLIFSSTSSFSSPLSFSLRDVGIL